MNSYRCETLDKVRCPDWPCGNFFIRCPVKIQHHTRDLHFIKRTLHQLFDGFLISYLNPLYMHPHFPDAFQFHLPSSRTALIKDQLYLMNFKIVHLTSSWKCMNYCLLDIKQPTINRCKLNTNKLNALKQNLQMTNVYMNLLIAITL